MIGNMYQAGNGVNRFGNLSHSLLWRLFANHIEGKTVFHFSIDAKNGDKEPDDRF
jgi:hypothetical protein